MRSVCEMPNARHTQSPTLPCSQSEIDPSRQAFAEVLERCAADLAAVEGRGAIDPRQPDCCNLLCNLQPPLIT